MLLSEIKWERGNTPGIDFLVGSLYRDGKPRRSLHYTGFVFYHPPDFPILKWRDTYTITDPFSKVYRSWENLDAITAQCVIFELCRKRPPWPVRLYRWLRTTLEELWHRSVKMNP